MNDWRDELVGQLLTPADDDRPGARAEARRGTLRQRFDEVRAAIDESVAYIAERAGVTVLAEPEPELPRFRWTHLSRHLLLRLEPDQLRFILSVTTERDYRHAELQMEGDRLFSHFQDRVAPADTEDLVRTFVSALFTLSDPEVRR
jgi:hypothetical protein